MDENLFSFENNTETTDTLDTAVGSNENPKTNSGIPVVRHKEKDKRRYIFAVLCIICALAGGIIGGIISGNIIKNSIEENQSTTASADSQSTTQTPQVTTTQPEVTTAKNNEQTTQQAISSGTVTSSYDKPSLEINLTSTDIYEFNVDSVVSIEVRSGYSVGYGTGFIVSEKGYIVTNYHVVEDAASVTVTLYDESVYSAEVIGFEESNDLAIIKIEPQGQIESLVYGSSSDLKVGDDVYVIGNPLGDLTFTFTKGIVSALNRLIDTGSGFTINMFQTDAAINSGNSGGPVFDKHGFVVGIASAKYASASIEGLSFCVPIDDVRSMIDEIINKGYVSGKPLLGVSVYDKEITSFGFLQSSRSINGAKIAAIGENSAAAKAGLQVGDIIIAADGENITTVSGLRTVLSDYRSGDEITLTINRNGTRTQATLILDEYEPASPRTNYSYVYDL